MIKAINALEYFMLKDWTFHNENVQGLWETLSPVDRKLFHFDVGALDWSDYVEKYQKGCKKFILHEGVADEDIEKAHRNMNKLWYAHKVVNLVILYMIYSMISSEFSRKCVSTLFHEVTGFFSLPVVSASEEESALGSGVLIEEVNDDILGSS